MIGADRDYRFGLITHRLPRKGVVVDVTELTPSDVQACLQSIPTKILRRQPFEKGRDSNAEPSLFELIEANVAEATLRQRFQKVLAELKNRPNHHDTLVMISYVHQCRVPVSLDMLIAFLRERVPDWNAALVIRDELGSMIAEYVGDLVDADQDYFVPRSTLIGETIVEATDNESLGRVISEFHREVSPYRICRYDVFRRSAYDADLFVRAFPDWRQGKAFYQELYGRDRSPFLLQQTALYLSAKAQHTEAFTMIDRALVASNNRQWSIRNSHAIIMFRANIKHSHTSTGHGSLKRSMDILTECYKWDKRRLFHALTFSDHALQYWTVADGEQARGEAKGYLATAAKWLDDELKSSPWNRRIKHLQPKIRQILS